jgi:hypothetical protein
MPTERFLNNHLPTGPEPGSDAFAGGTATAEGSVMVMHGVHMHPFPLVGMSVARARAELADRLNVDPDALAVIDGHAADEDAVLVEGQTLTFVKPAGEKG